VNDQGLYEIDLKDNSPNLKLLIEGSINARDSKPFYPNLVTQSKNGSIWVSQSNHSIGKWQNGEFKSYPFTKVDKAVKLTIKEDSQGQIWALSPIEGLFRYNTTTDTFEKKLDIFNCEVFLIDDNYVLLGNDALHIFEINGSDFTFVKHMGREKGTITALHNDENNEYYIGTSEGNLYHLETVHSPIKPIYGANEAHRVEQLPFGKINAIYSTADPHDTITQLWVGSETGLWHLQQRFFQTVDNLPMNNPIAISLNTDGHLWIPINYLFEITPDETDFTAKPVLDDLQVSCVANDASGSLWVTTTTPKVELLKYVNNTLVKRYDFSQRGESIFYLYPDSSGNLWFNQAPVNTPIKGTALITPDGTVKYYDETKGFSSRVLAIKESSRGEIYAVGIGERSYLYRFDKKRDRFMNISPKLPFKPVLNFEAHDLTIDNRGIVWLATTDGLLRYDGESAVLITNDILGQYEVRGVTHNPNNTIWVATATNGLVFLNENTATALGEFEGLPAVISAYRCITTDYEDRLWAGTAEGLVYSQASASELPYSNSPKIRGLRINQSEIERNTDSLIDLEKGERLEIQLTNLSYPAQNVQYQYRLLQKEVADILLEEPLWKTITEGSTLPLHSIDTGDYFIEIRARQPGGYQWSVPLELELKVFTPWYKNSWVLYAGVGLGVVLIGYYFRFYAMRRFKRLQNVLKYSNEKLAEKDLQLNKKIKELEEKGDKLVSATANIQTLELFIKEIPQQSSWDDIILAMGKAVMQTADINAFEIAFKEKNEIVHRGYSDQERSGYTFRAKSFDTKTSLTCWAMDNSQEVLINDFKKEHIMYIEEKDAYRFKSLLFIPFVLNNKQPVVLCAYSIEKNKFDQNDLTMFRILAQFIYLSIHKEISKEL
jgi:ligand-binding sensor domain-containing protein